MAPKGIEDLSAIALLLVSESASDGNPRSELEGAVGAAGGIVKIRVWPVQLHGEVGPKRRRFPQGNIGILQDWQLRR